MSEDDPSVVVIDNGSETCKVGFAGEDAPRAVFPSVVGHHCKQGVPDDATDVVVGDDVMNQPHLEARRSIVKGAPTDWADMEKIWRHIFNDVLRVDPKEYSVLLTMPPDNTKANNEKIAQILFEKLGCAAMTVVMPPVLSLYATGRKTGLVIDSGCDVTYVVPVKQGFAVKDVIQRWCVGGSDVTDTLKSMLGKRGHKFESAGDQRIVQNIKETLAYVAMDYEKELETAAKSASSEKNYVLPDGQTIAIGSERFRCTEALFEPFIMGKEVAGLVETIKSVIMACDQDIEKDMYFNIILAGGNTMFDGLAERLKKELSFMVPYRITVKVIAPADRKYSAWIGGSILGCLDTFKDICVTKQEYEEGGPSKVHEKLVGGI